MTDDDDDDEELGPVAKALLEALKESGNADLLRHDDDDDEEDEAMRHGNLSRRFDRPTDQRLAMFRGLVTDLLKHEQIKTTEAKAKAIRGLAEKMITLGKSGTLPARRRVLGYVYDKDVAAKLFDDLGAALLCPRRRLHAHRQARASARRQCADGAARARLVALTCGPPLPDKA